MLRLQGEADPAVQPRTIERRTERTSLFGDANEIVRVERRAVLTGERLGVTAGDEQATAPDVESGAGPPCA